MASRAQIHFYAVAQNSFLLKYILERLRNSYATNNCTHDIKREGYLDL